MAQTSTRPSLEPGLDTSVSAHADADEVESPSLSSSTALARFEFESGRKNDGTKVLLVEWEDDEATSRTPGEWHISWKDRESVLPADDQRQNNIHRLYLLLPPGNTVPPIITLTYVPIDPSKQTIRWKTNPLPAIFPPQLGATARAAGKKGVLHTLWAKRRLQSLQAEIEAESKTNAEGIGLEIVLQEKQWIEANFGVVAKRPAQIRVASGDSSGPPLSPRTPNVGRFLEKLGGLKLETNERDLSAATGGPEMPPLTSPLNPLSPDATDMAVSSFASIKGVDPLHPSAQMKHSSQASQPQSEESAASFPANPAPGRITSLAGVMDEAKGNSGPVNDDEKDDGLFALPMSPRSSAKG